MTEAHTYQLSTAENELGVVIAHSEEGKNLIFFSHLLLYLVICFIDDLFYAGHVMVPISWTQMQCPKSFSKEFRKVAKIVPEHVVAETSDK